MSIYSTTAQQGIDVNAVFLLDPVNALEYPAPPFQPGELAWGTDGSEWVYCTASLTIGAGQAVGISTFPGSWSVAPLVGLTITQTNGVAVNGITAVTIAASVGMLVGVVGGSQGTMVVPAPSGTQTGAYFWVQRAGNCPNLAMNGSGAIYSQLSSTAAASGSLTSAVAIASTTVAVNGIVWSLATASATGPNTAILNYPSA
jgi:hypothetical protein